MYPAREVESGKYRTELRNASRRLLCNNLNAGGCMSRGLA
jgi:hypothetical protein